MMHTNKDFGCFKSIAIAMTRMGMSAGKGLACMTRRWAKKQHSKRLAQATQRPHDDGRRNARFATPMTKRFQRFPHSAVVISTSKVMTDEGALNGIRGNVGTGVVTGPDRYLPSAEYDGADNSF